jgi:hypothetical protein
MIETAILANDNNDMLDRRRGPDLLDRVAAAVMIAIVVGTYARRKRECRDRCAKQHPAKPAR